MVTSLTSSGSQKKENSESDFRCIDARDVVTFDGEATSFMSSASGFQKKDRSEMDFQMKLTAFDYAAARELRLHLRRRCDFILVNRTSAFSFLMRWRQHEVDDEVDETRRVGRSQRSRDDWRRHSD